MENQSGCARWPCGLALVLLLALGLGSMASPTQAQKPAFDNVQLAPPITETASSATARGMFYQQVLAVTLPAESVVLASSPDGQGWLCTDDQATLRFMAGGRPALTWSHRFANADRRAIECLPPQRLELPLAATYQITVTLEDLYPTTSSSRPYYLVFATSAPPVEARAAPVPPATRAAAQPNPPATIKAATGANARPSVIATSEPLSTHTAASEPPGAGMAVAPGQNRRWMALLFGLALLIALAAWALWRRSRRPAAALLALRGILYLFDRETCEAHTALVRGGVQQLDIRRRPLHVEPVAAETGQSIAQIRPSPAGLLLYEPAADVAVPLVHDRLYTLAGGVVTLRYRAPGGRPPTTDHRPPTIVG